MLVRLIDADALLSEWAENPASYDMGNVINSVKNFPTVSGWISVKDRTPERGGTYLCFQPLAASFCMVNTYRWSTTNNVWRGAQIGSVITGITHWMPLPEPPKEDAV